MSQIWKWKCDRCGKEYDSPSKLKAVEAWRDGSTLDHYCKPPCKPKVRRKGGR